MSVVVDNSFSADTYGMRTERLIAIQTNFASIQTELQAPANIETWAEDCYDVYAAALSTSQLEANESEGATVVVAEKEAALDEVYQNVKNMGITIYKDAPKYIQDYGFELVYPIRRDDKLAVADRVVQCYARHVADGVTPLIPQVMITRLSDAREYYYEAIGAQDKERSDARHAVSLLSDRFVADTQMLNQLKIWWFSMMGKKDERITLIGMVNPQKGGSGGGTPTPVPAAPTNLVYHSEVPSITWDPVVGATSYEVQHKDDSDTEWNIIYTGTDTNLLHSDPPGDYNVRMRARSAGGFGEFSAILNYSVAPIQPD